MVQLSCPKKFHAFQLAEQLSQQQKLTNFFTILAGQKNRRITSFVKRIDKEQIPASKIKTFPLLALPHKLGMDTFLWNTIFDKLVAKSIMRNKEYQFFIGWSSTALHSMRKAESMEKIVLLERGSTHILWQQKILKEEYERQGLPPFKIDERVVEKELEEYEVADYIVTPSIFAKRSFLAHGFSKHKIFVNNFGANHFFQPSVSISPSNRKFRILFLGTLSVRKGIPYLIKALRKLPFHSSLYEVWFIGQPTAEVVPLMKPYLENWVFHGHVNHTILPTYINQCDVAVLPSLEEGLAMVIPQCLKCGIPVIASTNTGGQDIIENGFNGFILPIRTINPIIEHLTSLFENPKKLNEMKANARNHAAEHLNWAQYGQRYEQFLTDIRIA